MIISYFERYKNDQAFASSEHYTFHFMRNSLAEKDINIIIQTQETCFQNITRYYQPKYPFNIEYFLFNDSLECGNQWKLMREDYSLDNQEVNAFAWYPNQVFCTYNQKTKAIGYHEDIHLLTYSQNLRQSRRHGYVNRSKRFV